MIAVNWFGPYPSLEDARQAAITAWDHGLYMCIGKRQYQRNAEIQYIGIGKQLHTRLEENHHKLKMVTSDRKMWLGEVATAEPSGKKVKVTRVTLDYAEWLHARFMHLPLNENKTKGLPQQSVTILNRWWKTDYSTVRNQRPHPDWPDLIDFPGYEMPARKIWFGGKQIRYAFPDYAQP